VRIGFIGKFPPIQGGVSTRSYLTAHALAMHGHDVHVITNAAEVQPPYRMFMRAEDWARCEARYSAGAVMVHWTDPIDRSRSYIPMTSPFVSKLSAIAANVHRAHPFDVIFSHYLEPYGVAGYLAAQMSGAPHVVRTAGSDAGRLWHHPQFEAVYDHVLRSADVVIAAGTVAERAIRRGVDPGRVFAAGDIAISDSVFCPDGTLLDLPQLQSEISADTDLRKLMWGTFGGDRPYFGVYGKLGEKKGSFALLEAMHRLKQAGHDVGLVALAHGPPDVERRFRARARQLGLTDCILQLPFLPHWRVPEFLRSCLAVCCLEQDFPIHFHSPIIPREVLLCGGCLVAATEIIRKIPGFESLPHGYGCVAIRDVNDVNSLAGALAAIADDPTPRRAVGMRGRTFAETLQKEVRFPQRLEEILQAAAALQVQAPVKAAAKSAAMPPAKRERFPLTRLAAEGCGYTIVNAGAMTDIDVARDTLRKFKTKRAKGLATASIAAAIGIEIALAEAEDDLANNAMPHDPDPLFRLHIRRWALDEGALDDLVPVQSSRQRLITFDFDVAALLHVRTIADFPPALPGGPSHMIVFGGAGAPDRSPLLVDGRTAQILQLIDGRRTVGEIVNKIAAGTDAAELGRERVWIEYLFQRDLISLRDGDAGHRPETRPKSPRTGTAAIQSA
jgi:glycosyltransferase involved in cell wall biosynthesis